MIQPLISLALWAAAHSAAALPVTAVEALPAPDSAPVLQDPVAKPEPKWTGSVTVGGVLTTGNSETRQGNAEASAEYRREKDRFSLGFLWTYAEERNSTPDWNLTDRKTGGRFQYDYFLSEKTYLLAQVSGENDHQAAVELRTTIGVGAGHQFLENETWKFAAEAGLTAVDNDYAEVTGVASSDTSYVAARLAANTDWNCSKSWTFTHRLALVPSLEDSNDFNAHSELAAKLTLTENMLAQLLWVLDYDKSPATGKDTTDNRYLLSVGWKF